MSKPYVRHAVALLGMAVVFVAAFARLIFRAPDGTPFGLIPWDFMSQCYPWQVYIGDTFQAGKFPLWVPYVGAGSPFFINPQSQLYSPVTLLVSLLFGYTQRSVQLHTLAMVFMGGVGAYLLSVELWRGRAAGVVSGLAFCLTSAVYGNLEHMTTTNTYVLMPWLFWTSVLAVRRDKRWALPLLAFFIYFLITSGYPTIILMTLLWVGAYTLFELHARWGEPARERLRVWGGVVAAWALGLGLAAVHWLPIGLHSGEFTRGKPMPAEQVLAQHGNITFKDLWGVLFQFMTVSPLPGSSTDISMRGLYFGVLALVLALVAVRRSPSRFVGPLVVLTSGAFLMACGAVFFGRAFLHLSIPAFNLSRFPASDSRALAVLGAVTLAGGGAQLLRSGDAEAFRLARRTCVVLLGLLLVGLVFLKELMPAETYNETVLLYTSAELLFVGSALLVLERPAAFTTSLALAVLLALELGTGVLSNTFAIAHPIKPEAYALMTARHQRRFTLEGVNVPREYDGDPMSEQSQWGFVEKRFMLSDYNPMRLGRWVELEKRGFTDWLRTGARVVALPSGAQPENAAAFQAALRPVDFEITRYEPNRVDYRLVLTEPSRVVFNEIYFPGWRVSVDGGARQPLLDVAGGLRALELPAGTHELRTSFAPRTFVVGLTVSLVSLAVWLGWVGVLAWRARRRRQDAPPALPPAGAPDAPASA
ncbi:hypothetical protein [Melittangium boletus]|uniref:hypothetical protein n=1 Tax=Melittangium boletus TaxID=83453 RepID=UPI003DA24017